jgi:hypothetical protein
MLPIVLGAMRTYAPYLVFPFAFVVGGIGYVFETRFRSSQSLQQAESTLESRQDRQLDWVQDDPTKVDKLSRTELPRDIFDRQEKPRWKLR